MYCVGVTPCSETASPTIPNALAFESAINFLGSNFQFSDNYIVSPDAGLTNNVNESGINLLCDVNSLVNIITK